MTQREDPSRRRVRTYEPDPHEAFLDGAKLDRPVSADQWHLPEVLEVRRGALLWRYGRRGQVTPTRSVFQDFLRLAEADDEEICAFAKCWGVLYLCAAHGLPSSHAALAEENGRQERAPVEIAPSVYADADVTALFASGWFARCPLVVTDGDAYLERTEDWRRFAREASTTFHLALQVHRENLGEPEAWGKLFGPQILLDENGRVIDRPGAWHPSNLSEARFRLASVVNRWLQAAQLQPILWWGDRATVTLGNRTLFGYLAVQLLLSVSKRRGLAVCSCGDIFGMERQVGPGRNAYCPKCGRSAATRDASRRLRQKQRCARRLVVEGVTIADIARQLDTTPYAVRGWVKAEGRQRNRRADG